MSKIYEKNLALEAIRTYWKRFEASVTAFADKYRFDPFLRTQINVIVMLVTFSALILGLVGTLVSYLYHDISFAVVTGVRESLLAYTNDQIPVATPALQDIQTSNLSAIALVTTSITILFGYLLTRVALSPTRNALASQKQFIGNVAHELRTPLAIIKTDTEITLLDEHLNPDVRRTLQSTLQELDRLSDIINNLLSLSESIRPERIGFSPVDVSEVAAEVIERFQMLARARHIALTIRVDDDCFVWGNRGALEQILTNLIKNALQYTSRDGRITVSIEQAASRVEIDIKDTGVGIPRKDLAHIFEPFYRAEPSRNRAQGSSGLGLTIVSELVRLHKGRIAVRSTVGYGTTVAISLPVIPAPSHVKAQRHESEDEVSVDFSHT